MHRYVSGFSIENFKSKSFAYFLLKLLNLQYRAKAKVNIVFDVF